MIIIQKTGLLQDSEAINSCPSSTVYIMEAEVCAQGSEVDSITQSWLAFCAL